MELLLAAKQVFCKWTIGQLREEMLSMQSKSLVDRQSKEGSWQRTATETSETVLPTLRASLLAMRIAESCWNKALGSSPSKSQCV